MFRPLQSPFALCIALTVSLVGCGPGAPTPTAPVDPAASVGPDETCLQAAAAEREMPADAPSSVMVSHLVVRHADLDRPEGATRTPAEACLRVLQARVRLEQGDDWDALVAEFSDSPGPMSGALGSVRPTDLEPTFAAAAFSLGVGEVSYVVETPRGFHLILRTE